MAELAYSVDRSWGNVRHNADGEMYPSDDRKMHRRNPDRPGMPACGARVLLNDDRPEHGIDPARVEGFLCRRCFPKPSDSGS